MEAAPGGWDAAGAPSASCEDCTAVVGTVSCRSRIMLSLKPHAMALKRVVLPPL